MTLIALTVNHGYPVMMADILISSKESDKSIALPTFVRGTGKMLVNVDGYRPLCLEQKLYVINERLCVALGGRGDQMRTLLRRLNAIYGANDFNDDDLIKFIETYPKDESDELIAIVLMSWPIANGEFAFAVRCIGNLRILNNSLYDKVIAGGSGSKQFLDFIASNPKFESDIENTDAFLASNQSLIAYWLGQEVSRGDSLLNHWGAGYEMIIFTKGKFVKLEEYTVVLMVGKFGKNIKFEAAPFSTMMISYQDDVLIIRVFAHNEEKIFAAPSILDERSSIGVLDIEPRHDTLLMVYILEDVIQNKEYTPAIIFPRNKNQDGKTPIVFKRVGDKLQLHKDDRADDYILNQIN